MHQDWRRRDSSRSSIADRGMANSWLMVLLFIRPKRQNTDIQSMGIYWLIKCKPTAINTYDLYKNLTKNSLDVVPIGCILLLHYKGN
jgi:hypothetical protein